MSDFKWNEELVDRMKQRDESAFEQCYLITSPYIYTVIYNICRQKDSSQELLQDTFLDIFQNIDSYKSQQPFLAWAKRIAFNNTLNFIKRNKRLVLFGDLPEQDFEIEVCMLEQLIDSQLIESLFAKITEIERFIIWLFIVEQYNHEEIAILVGKTPSYSKSIISRTLKRIRLSKEAKDHAH